MSRAVSIPKGQYLPDFATETSETDGVPESNGLHLKQINESNRAGFTRSKAGKADGGQGEAEAVAESGGADGVPESNELHVKRINESNRAGLLLREGGSGAEGVGRSGRNGRGARIKGPAFEADRRIEPGRFAAPGIGPFPSDPRVGSYLDVTSP